MTMKAHEKVMQWVTEELAEGRLGVGDSLPGERSLAETLGVSRSSIREALKVLEALGTLRSGTGSGPRAGTIISAAPEQAFSLALSLQLATRHVEHTDITEVRLLLETWAADHAGPTDWSAAEHLLESMEAPDLSVEEFLALDAKFHVELSHSANNPLISTLMEALRLSIADHTLELAGALPDWQATSTRLRHEHHQILDALRTGQHDRGRELMRSHIEGYAAETRRASHLSRTPRTPEN